MKITVNIPDVLYQKACEVSGFKENKLFNEVLRAYIRIESAKKLSNLGGTDQTIEPVKRR